MRQYAHGMLSDKGLGIWWFDKELHGLQDQVFTGQQKGSCFFKIVFSQLLGPVYMDVGAPR